jgi:hypothetical protein
MGVQEVHHMAGKASGTAEQVWRERMKRWRKSDQTVSDFCWREGVSEPSFYQWRKRLTSGPVNSRGKKPVVFVPVVVADSLAASGQVDGALTQAGRWPLADACLSVEIVLPGGVTLRAGSRVDEQHLRGVLRAVVAETRGC